MNLMNGLLEVSRDTFKSRFCVCDLHAKLGYRIHMGINLATQENAHTTMWIGLT
ncbi:MAG TPA: hypothetical protein V6C78_22335 [Crinalium sp.]